MAKKTSEIKPEKNNSSIMSRIRNGFNKLADSLSGTINPDNPRNIDNPDNEYYGYSDEYWQNRTEAEKNDRENAGKTKDALDKYLQRQKEKVNS